MSQEPLQNPIQRWGLAVSLGVVVLAVFLACRGWQNHDWTWTAAGLGMAYLICRFLAKENMRVSLKPGLELSLLTLVILGGIGLRFYKIGDIPVGMHSDESLIIEASYQISKGFRPTFMTMSGWHQGSIPTYLSAMFIKVLGPGITPFRLTAAVMGLLLILGTYVLARGWFGPWVALCTATFAALELWPVALARKHYMEQVSALFLVITLAGLVWGLRRRNYWGFALAGLFMGANLNTYMAGLGVLVLIPVFVASLLVWDRGLLRGSWRGWLVFVPCFFLGTAPLLHWFFSSAEGLHGVGDHLKIFTLGFRGPHISDGLINQDVGILSKLNGFTASLLHSAPKTLSMFVERGPIQMFHFLDSMPIINRISLISALTGLVLCLARFRSSAYAYIPLWLAVGLVPSMLTLSNPDARRAVMAVPAFSILAGLGCAFILGGMAHVFQRDGARRALGAVGILVLALWVGKSTAYKYFVVINQSIRYMDFNSSNLLQWTRAVFEANQETPSHLLSYKRPILDSFLSPSINTWDHAIRNVNYGMPMEWLHEYPKDFTSGGILDILEKKQAQYGGIRSTLIALSPFYYYLEDFLIQDLGGRLLSEVPVVRSPQGICERQRGVIRDPDSLLKLIRIPYQDPKRLKALGRRKNLPAVMEGLIPPGDLPRAEMMAKTNSLGPKTLSWLRDYRENPLRWGTGETLEMRRPEPYFWTYGSAMSRSILPPFRYRYHWILNIPEAGSYTLGVNASIYTSVRVDGKEVLHFFITRPGDLVKAQKGVFGEPLFLEKGPHRLEVEQVVLNLVNSFMQEFRLLWEKPSGKIEVVPMEILSAPGDYGRVPTVSHEIENGHFDDRGTREIEKSQGQKQRMIQFKAG